MPRFSTNKSKDKDKAAGAMSTPTVERRPDPPPEPQQPQHTPRKVLPVPQPDKNSSTLWSFLKNCVGRELSKITMPVQWNEPISFLQRLSEYMNYAYLLKLAADQKDNPENRMMFVATFAVSALASNFERMGKPFNPLLGETYELQREDFRIVCEQVS